MLLSVLPYDFVVTLLTYFWDPIAMLLMVLCFISWTPITAANFINDLTTFASVRPGSTARYNCFGTNSKMLLYHSILYNLFAPCTLDVSCVFIANFSVAFKIAYENTGLTYCAFKLSIQTFVVMLFEFSVVWLLLTSFVCALEQQWLQKFLNSSRTSTTPNIALTMVRTNIAMLALEFIKTGIAEKGFALFAARGVRRKNVLAQLTSK